jgi:hypothetical protein
MRASTRRITRGALCVHCHRRGLSYHPFTRGGRRGAVMLCHACGSEVEL